MAISPGSGAGRGFSLRALYYPHGAVPVKLHEVSTMLVLEVSSHIYTGQLFHLAPDTERCIKRDTNAIYLIRASFNGGKNHSVDF